MARKAGTATGSTASAGAEAESATARNGRIERMGKPPWVECRYICSATIAACPALTCGYFPSAAFRCDGPAFENHRQLCEPLRPKGARLPQPQGPRLRNRPDHAVLRE